MKSKPLFAFPALLYSVFIFHTSLFAAASGGSGGIELGLQTYTFRDRTLAEAFDRAVAMKIKYVQATGRKISPTTDEKFGPNMSAAAKAEICALLKARGLTLTSYGVVTGKDEADWCKIFAFAKEMGLRDIATEPRQEDLPLIAKLSAETGVNVAIHNHPPPTCYYDPETVLAAIKPYGKNIGFCADTGHWARSGYDPVAALRKAEGRIISLHYKDLTERDKKAHDMPWGAGSSDAALQILELRRQGFNGIVYMEYEYMTPALDAETAASADWFHRAIAASDDDLRRGRVLPAGYVDENRIEKTWAGNRGTDSKRWAPAQPLFTDTFANAECDLGSWEYKDGVLASKGDTDIWAKETYGDFALNLDFRCAEKTDSGVLLRCSDTRDWEQNAIEVQILQGDAANEKHLVSGIYDLYAPHRQVEIEPGKWYHYTIIAKGSRITVMLDGERLSDIDLSQRTQAARNPDGTGNKYKKAPADMALAGRIGLQHGKSILFRNIVVEPIR